MLVDAVYTVVAGRQRRRSYSITCASLSSCGSSMRRTRPGISVKGLKSRREGCWTRDASYIPMIVRRSTAGTATTLTLDLVSDDGALHTTAGEMGVARTLLVVVGEREGLYMRSVVFWCAPKKEGEAKEDSQEGKGATNQEGDCPKAEHAEYIARVLHYRRG